MSDQPNTFTIDDAPYLVLSASSTERVLADSTDCFSSALSEDGDETPLLIDQPAVDTK